jgi:methylthioribose-1-phosphate isomerase
MSSYRSIEWRNGALRLLDQRLLPHQTVYLTCTSDSEVAVAIRDMVVRGAPAIGVAAAYAIVLAAGHHQADLETQQRALRSADALLRAARPTAVNLAWALDRMQRRWQSAWNCSPSAIYVAVLAEAQSIAEEDIRANRQIGLNALPLIPDDARIIHHCNTGSLATVDYGTALGIIRAAHEHGKRVHVYVDETRPRLQGARLTAWELAQLGIPHTVVVDGAAGYLMQNVGVDLCVVGCDRVAANGDTANKIGTYTLALVAQAHDVPFYVAAPLSTIDLNIRLGDSIPIEERPAREVTHVGIEQITPAGTQVANPAFDITPGDYITAIITEAGIAYPPYKSSLPLLVAQARAAHDGYINEVTK